MGSGYVLELVAAVGRESYGRNITIDGCSVFARSKYGAGIGGSNGGSGYNIIINGGSVTASSESGAGIGGGEGGSGEKITINGSSVTASSDNGAGIGGGKGGSGNKITINGGSVKATRLDYKPQNSSEQNVYCCTIENKNSDVVIIDGNSTSWEPKNHLAVDPKDTNLYAWLTEADHTITVGTEERKYSFNQNTKQFSRIKTDPTAAQFELTQQNFTYNKDNPVNISKYIKWKDDVTGHGEITHVTYFKKDGTSPINSPTDAGTYTFKINVDKGEYYNSAKDIEWTFTIEKAPVAPGADPNETTISVPWSCKKISNITNLFRLTGNGITMLSLIRNYKLENPLQLPQFTMATIRGITKKNLSFTQSPERNANTKIQLDATIPLHPVLPVDIAGTPIVTTAREPSITAPRFLHMAMTMTTALSLQNQL